MPDSLTDEVYAVLTHFYDYAYISGHPILERFRPLLGGNTTGAVRQLRRMVLETIEALRPPLTTPSTDMAWRPYIVLHNRYIVGKELEQVAEELHIGERQVQREQKRAIEALAAALADKLPACDDLERGVQRGDALWTEISIVSGEPCLFDAAEELEGALQAVAALAQNHGVALHLERDPRRMLVAGSRPLFRQLALGALSYVIRAGITKALLLHMARRGNSVICSLTATAPLEVEAPELPEVILALAQAQGVTCTHERLTEGWRLTLTLPTIEQPYNVILVEDNADIIALFTRYLATEGYHLIGVQESNRALDRIAEIRPDAVVLDVMMANPDGWALLQRLKSDPELRHIPVVVCSVLDERELAVSLGADAYLRKPIRSALLLECLATLCRQHNWEAGSC